jgi:phosphatidylserine decarboxylase
MSWRQRLSLWIGWAADIRVPRPLRPLVYGLFERLSGADLSEGQLPAREYPSVGALFVRRLRPGARPICPPPGLPCPADGRLQALAQVAADGRFEAKGQRFTRAELLGPADRWLPEGALLALTVYLSPRDYHRVHCPLAARLIGAWTLPGERFSVSPAAVERRPRIHAENERVVLLLEAPEGRFALVLVGALNVGRIRVLGLPAGHQGPLEKPLAFERGGELGRFELGSTAILLWPSGNPRRLVPSPSLAPDQPLRLGQPWAELA